MPDAPWKGAQRYNLMKVHMHLSLGGDSPRRQCQRTQATLSLCRATLSLWRGEEAFRARGEGLLNDEPAGEAHEILLSVQRLR